MSPPDPQGGPDAERGSTEATRAFGVPPEKWYKRWGAPRTPYAKPLAVASGLIVLFAATAVHGTGPKLLLYVAVVGLPGWALERWWRTRRRREEETLIPDQEG